MNIQKLLSSNVSTHHPEPAIILTEAGEVFMTKKGATAGGYELVRFLDVDMINSRINTALSGLAVAGVAEAELVNQSIQVSNIANCFKVINYPPNSVISNIAGGVAGQIITIICSANELTILANSTLLLGSDMVYTNDLSTLHLQKDAVGWREISRSYNS
jgi:hydrogenase maturation factor HypE